jgi:hypothetical protein
MREIEDMAITEAMKWIAKAILPRNAVNFLKRVRGESWPPVPFDNVYEWLNYAFSDLFNESTLIKHGYRSRKPMYAWGVLQGAALAKVLGLPRVSVIEFGVACGNGLLALEAISKAVEQRTNVRIDAIGFDSGVGLPQPQDFRDQPNMWLEGQLPMNRTLLESKLLRAQLYLGPIAETIPYFIAANPAPIAFISFDLDLYSSTRDALCIFESSYDYLLPRVISYFDDIFGHTYNDYCGERAAIAEFNNYHSACKICPIYGLRYFIPHFARNELWPSGMYFAHLFEHPSYNIPDSFNKVMVVDIEGTFHWRQVHLNHPRPPSVG